MGLFDQILSAVNNPEQEASGDQLGMIVNTVQQLAGDQGGDAGASQMLMSIVGTQVRSALQDQRNTNGMAGIESLIQQYAGVQPNASAVQALFSPAQQQQLAETIAAKTGMNPEMATTAMSAAVPIVLNILKTGQSSGGDASNNVLNSFMDADGDGEVDMGDAFSMATRFLSK